MTENFNKKSASLLITFASILIVLSALLIGGCGDTLTGDQFANQAPIVQFVNAPPGPTFDTVSTSPLVIDTNYTKFSRNPFIYWFGTDNDGQIDFFRYVIVTELELGATSPDAYIPTLTADSARWTYLNVSVEEGDPHTTQVVSLEALTADPVNRYLVQFIYIQAFDEEGLGSKVVYRGYSRNDSPPVTSIGFLEDKPFINSEEVGIVTGISLRWKADDPDYPAGTNAPPFEFQWILYGPFSDAQLANIQANFISPVFVTEDARVYGNGDTIIACDTTFESGGSIVCDTLVVGIDDLSSVRGRSKQLLETELLEADASFDPLQKVLQSNGWTNDSSKTLFNVYRNFTAQDPNADTTVQMNFIFWVKSRDDAVVEDLVPAFKYVKVIDPKFERAIMVVDFTRLVGPLNDPTDSEIGLFGTQREVWKEMIDRWGYDNVPGWNNNSFNMTLNSNNSLAPDYMIGGKFSSLPVVELLKHKVVVMYNDDIYAPKLALFKDIYASIDAGVNVWATMRSPVFGDLGPVDMCEENIPASAGNYGFYFASTSYSYSGWFRHYFTGDDPSSWYPIPMRIDHFKGANSLRSDKWPSLPIDTARLHALYSWGPSLDLEWDPSTAALPEVNWMAFRAKFSQGGFLVEAEPMYLFDSKYGADHPGGGCLSDYDGSPVAHRVKGSYFKTVHFSFTPLAIQVDSMQVIADTVFNYLYEPNQSAPLTKKNLYRYEKTPISQR